MSIPESDVSILIPTYRYREKVVRAVQSALASGAREIIVTDDRSQDGTIEALLQFDDPRLTVIENEQNLGLWENHLRALGLATRPWIKFIQADDFLLPGGLAIYAAAAAPEVSVIAGAPILKDDLTGKTWLTYMSTQPLTLAWPEFERACHLFGWFLGSPSYMMLRNEVITRDPRVWRRTVSADLVVGSIAASLGRVVILPPGAICHGSHPLQDARTQNASLGLARSANSLAHLRSVGDLRLRRLADAWAVLNLRPTLRTLARGLIRGEGAPIDLLASAWLYFTSAGLSPWVHMLGAGAEPLRDAKRYRTTHRPPFNLDELFGQPGARDAA